MREVWKADHWLYRIIPRTWAEAGWWPFEWLLWALFGNDEDGIFGEWTSHWYDDHGAKPSLTLFFLWQLRNPFHNLMSHVFVWPTKGRYLAGRYYDDGGGWHFNWRADAQLWQPGPQKQISFSVWPPSVSWKIPEGTDGYLFFAKDDGSLGFAIRKHNSTGA